MVAADAQRSALRESVDAIRGRSDLEPELALVLGTGLGGVADGIDLVAAIDYGEIPHFPRSTVPSHAGRLLLGTLAGRRVVALQGRFHAYEGYSLQQATLPVRTVSLLGARAVVTTGAAGALNPTWREGDVAAVYDHLNLLGDNPLMGPNLDELGPRFPDMSEPYDDALLRLAEDAALELGVRLHRGVYAAVSGPNLETPAEHRMLRFLGADLVGMSTVPEVLVARHMGMRVLALTVVTNVCLPDAPRAARIEDVIRVANQAEARVSTLLSSVLARMPTTGRQAP